MEGLKSFILDLNKEARQNGFDNGLSAYYSECGVQFDDYLQMLARFDSEFENYERSKISAKRRRFLCYAVDAPKILSRCGIDIGKSRIEYCEDEVEIEGQRLVPPFIDMKTKTIYIKIEDGKIDIKSLAHELGHLKTPKKQLNSLNAERIAIEYEMKLIKMLCQNDQLQYFRYRLDRIFNNLIKAELKRFLFETEDFSAIQQKLNELNAKYDLLNSFDISLNDITDDFKEFSYLFAISLSRNSAQ